ncbi:MAG TPA: DNA alkylation repair protein [Pyrinomonadaceae bacterium]|jgi:3-methyladenine DNA glycosylase AlkD
MSASNLKSKSQTTPVRAIVEEIEARVKALPELKTRDVREVRREFSRRLKNAGADFVFQIALALVQRPAFEFRFIAYELAQHHPATLSSLNKRALEELGRNVDSWYAVDCFACYLAGPAWREGQIRDNVVHGWAGSSDRWWRRAALVATVPLNNKTRGGSGDTERTLAVCRLLLNDRDDMVVKAMSWALRELAKRDAVAVKRFLREEEHMLAPRVLREVTNKLATGLKNPKRPANKH